MKPKYLDTAILSISSNNIKSCDDIAKYFLKSGILCSVVSNTSVIRDGNQLYLEKGCNITLPSLDTDVENIENNIWNPLKMKYDLSCAHFNVIGKYKGCIYNYINRNPCPK